MDCFAALAMTWRWGSNVTLGCRPRACGDPVRRGLSVQSLLSLEYWVTRSSAQLRTRRVMTSERVSAFSRRIPPEVCRKTSRPLDKGAGKTGCLLHPRSRVRFAQTKLHTSIQGSGNTPAFPAQWLYGLLRALPGERLFCLRRPRDFLIARLNASTAAPEPHDFAVRVRRVRLSRPQRPPHLTARS